MDTQDDERDLFAGQDNRIGDFCLMDRLAEEEEEEEEE